MGKHVIFYDGECGLCDKAVQFVLKQDESQQFDFAPLQGSTASKTLKTLSTELKNNDSLILIENYKTPHSQIYILGKGALRVCWLLGGVWTIPGTLSWLPSWIYNWGYCLVAKNRHRFFKETLCVIPSKENQHRFLP